jgi:hypothetical protein
MRSCTDPEPGRRTRRRLAPNRVARPQPPRERQREHPRPRPRRHTPTRLPTQHRRPDPRHGPFPDHRAHHLRWQTGRTVQHCGGDPAGRSTGRLLRQHRERASSIQDAVTRLRQQRVDGILSFTPTTTARTALRDVHGDTTRRDRRHHTRPSHRPTHRRNRQSGRRRAGHPPPTRPWPPHRAPRGWSARLPRGLRTDHRLAARPPRRRPAGASGPHR